MFYFKMLLVYLSSTLLLFIAIHVWKYRRYYYLGFKLPRILLWKNLQFLAFVVSWTSMETITKIIMDLYAKENSRLNSPVIAMWFGTKLVVVLTDPDMIKKIFNDELQKDPQLYFLFDQTIQDKSVITENHLPKWREHRKIITAASFNLNSIKSHLKIMYEEANILADKMAEMATTGESFEHIHMLSLASSATILRTFCGCDLEIQQNFHHEYPVVTAAELENVNAVECIRRPWFYLGKFLNLTPERAVKTRHMCRNFVEDIVDRAKGNKFNEKDIGLTNKKENQSPQNFIEIIHENQLNPNIPKENIMSHNDLVTENAAILAAGLDTTKTATAMIMIMLGLHPDIQQEVYEELISILGEDPNIIPTYHQLQELHTLSRVIKETLRLYPPVHLMARQSEQEISVAGYTIPKGVGMYVVSPSLHRDPHYWGPNADQFIPDRFLSNNSAEHKAFLAFSMGPRNCLGMKYAVASMKLTMAALLRRYRVLPGDKCRGMEDVRCKFGLTLCFVPGANDIRLESRF